MHSGRPSTGSAHAQGHVSSGTSSEPRLPPRAMLSAGASAAPPTGLSLFRGGSLTHGEPRVLAAVGGHYNGGGSGAASSSLGPYSPLFSVHGQSSPLASVSPYSSFFSQYPANPSPYSPASLMASARLPPIESYSAVLASMGTHAQHGAHANPQGQGPRAGYLPLGQYSHHSLSSTTSPGPASAHSPGSTSSFSLREREALLHQSRADREGSPSRHRPRMSTGTPPDDKKHLPQSDLLYPRRPSPGGLLKEVKNEQRDGLQKGPGGIPASLKHRILTSDMTSGYKGRSQSLKEDVVPSKRARFSVPSETAPSPPDSHVFVPPHAVGPAPASSYASKTSPSPSLSATTHITSQPPESNSSPAPHLHYPPHFLKGSIIQLANGDLKRVEDLQTEDFVSSAQVSADLKVDSSTVVRIEGHPDHGTVTLGFSVGEHRVQLRANKLNIVSITTFYLPAPYT